MTQNKIYQGAVCVLAFLLLTTHAWRQVTHYESNYPADASKSCSIYVDYSDPAPKYGTFGKPASIFGSLPVGYRGNPLGPAYSSVS